MIITRSIGKVLRGRASPFQILVSGILAGLLAFQPGFSAAPGLFLVPILLLIVLNGSLPFAGLIWAPLKLLSLAILPQTFAVGRFLIDGPTEGLWTKLINGPVVAWFGFDNYVASGGLVLGLATGTLLGLGFAALLRALRRKLASLEEGSERYQKLIAKPWTKILLFLFVGGSRGKQSWGELAERRIGNPVRLSGLVVAVLVGLGLYFAQKQLATPLLTQELQSTLESWNGATVDLAKAELALGEGRVALHDLALADPDDLAVDSFRTSTIEADASTEDFLRKHLRIERLAIAQASSGSERSTPGRRVAPVPGPSQPPTLEEGEKSLDDYLADYERWRARLEKLKQWMDKLARQADRGEEAPGEGEQDESLRERLEREAREQGWAAVRATHRVTGAPAILVSETAIEDFNMASIPGEVFSLRAYDLSSDAELCGKSPRVELASHSGNVRMALDLNATAPSAERPGILLEWKGLASERLMSQLQGEGSRLLEGGTVDLSLRGGWSDGRVGFLDLPLEVKVSHSTLNLGDLGSAPVENFSLPIHLRGPLDGLSVRVDTEELGRALREAGANELERKLREKAAALRGELEARVEEEKRKLQEKVDQTRQDLEQQVDQSKQQLEQKVDEAKQAAEKKADEKKQDLKDKAGEEAKGLLEGALGGKKKKKDGG